jgi:hypothetical protein
VALFGEPAPATTAKLVLSTPTGLCGSFSLSALTMTQSGELVVQVPSQCLGGGAGDLRIELAGATTQDQFGYLAVHHEASTVATGGGETPSGTASDASPGSTPPPPTSDAGGIVTAACDAEAVCDCTGVACGDHNACGARCVCGDFQGDVIVKAGSGNVCWVGDITIRAGESFAAILGEFRASR